MTKVIYLRVPDDMADAIDELAKREKRSQNMQAQILLGLGLNHYDDPSQQGTPTQITGVPPKIEDVKTFVKQGQNAQKAAEKIISEANASGVSTSAELPCCMNELQPCKHWVWDTASGEGYRNVLSGRFLEVE